VGGHGEADGLVDPPQLGGTLVLGGEAFALDLLFGLGLEEQLIRQRSVDEYLDASNHERTRALHTLAKRLEIYGFDSDYLFVEANRRILSTDTLERQVKDRETIEAWYMAQGRARLAEVEGAKLETRGGE